MKDVARYEAIRWAIMASTLSAAVGFNCRNGEPHRSDRPPTAGGGSMLASTRPSHPGRETRCTTTLYSVDIDSSLLTAWETAANAWGGCCHAKGRCTCNCAIGPLHKASCDNSIQAGSLDVTL